MTRTLHEIRTGAEGLFFRYAADGVIAKGAPLRPVARSFRPYPPVPVDVRDEIVIVLEAVVLVENRRIALPFGRSGDSRRNRDAVVVDEDVLCQVVAVPARAAVLLNDHDIAANRRMHSHAVIGLSGSVVGNLVAVDIL